MRAWLAAIVVVAGCGRLDFDALGDGGPGDGSPAPRAVHLALQTDHTCMIDDQQQMWCWGDNRNGALGNRDPAFFRAIPQPIAMTGWTKVTAGDGFTLAIRSDGTLWGWGNDQTSNLGDPSDTDEPVPWQLVTDTWLDVSASEDEAAGIRSDGSLWGWGLDNAGELGPAAVAGEETAPVMVAAGPFVQLSYGYTNICAIEADQTLWCDGDNGNGQLGRGTTGGASSTFVQVPGSWREVAAMFDSECAIDTSDQLWCWGSNQGGQLGFSATVTMATSPMLATEPGPWASLGHAAGAVESGLCAIKRDGTAWCWGGNFSGQLGTGNFDPVGAPTEIPELTGATEIWLGASSTCAVVNSVAMCSGVNGFGELGTGIPASSGVPRLADSQHWTSLAGGGDYACGKTASGWSCWGTERYIEATATNLSQVPVPLAGTWTTVTVAGDHACAVAPDSTISCWGENSTGQLGDGTQIDHATPQSIGAQTWSAIASDEMITVALSSTGERFQWGSLYPSAGTQLTPLDDGDSGWTAVATGDSFGCVVGSTTGCWGDGANGQLGTTATSATTPTVIPGTFQAIAARGNSGMAIASDGSIWSWGILGLGPTITPAAQLASPAWLSIAVGLHHACAIRADHTLWCIGNGVFGNLGDGHFEDSATFVQAGSDSNWESVAVGDAASCALKLDGSRWCWGDGNSGIFGDGHAWSTTFQPVIFP